MLLFSAGSGTRQAQYGDNILARRTGEKQVLKKKRQDAEQVCHVFFFWFIFSELSMVKMIRSSSSKEKGVSLDGTELLHRLL